MMPHERCQRSSCWLNSFFAINHIPVPKFCLGQRVRSEYVSADDGQTYVDEGVVMGVFPAPPRWLAGWWYWVSWEILGQSASLPLPHLDETHESDLQPVEEGMN